jgi:MYXO-CTERM domain-containing protein
MKRGHGCLTLVLFLGVSTEAIAQSNPAEGYWENDGVCSTCTGTPHFSWTFGGTDPFGTQTFSYFPYGGIAGALPGFGATETGAQEFSPLVGIDQWTLDFEDRGFDTDVLAGTAQGAPIRWQRRTYLPSGGDAFARFLDTWTNDGPDDITLTIDFNGVAGPGSGAMSIIQTGDGDSVPDPSDGWMVFDDGDGTGMPASAFVWQSAGAPVQATGVEFSDVGLFGSNHATITFADVPIPAGGSVTLGFFEMMADSREDAEAAAAAEAEMSSFAQDYVDEVEDTLQNFRVGPPGSPRLRSHGPYLMDEGTSTDLGIEVYDDEGDAVTYSWDLNGDGTFGDEANNPAPHVDGATADGPSVIRVGLEMSDGVNTVDRTIVVRVNNVPPVITSVPPSTARTDEEYLYTVTATDIPTDPLTYELLRGPDDMTMSSDGVVHWTPPAGGALRVAVRIRVTDDDGGEALQDWTIDVAGAPSVLVDGLYRCPEGGEIVLAPVISDPENDPLTYAWDTDGDGIYDDGNGPTVTWSAAGIDGPAGGYEARIVVSDGTYDVSAELPIEVTNEPPEFRSQPPATAVVGREWSYTLDVVDPGGDPFEITVEDTMPDGMTYDEPTQTFSWTPDAAALAGGDPAGTYAFGIRAEDDEGAHSRQDIQIRVGANQPPPTPPIRYPDGTEPVEVVQPTIVLGNVQDPEGDAVTYFIQVDADPCFCTPDLQSSGGLPEGAPATQWPLPQALNVDVSAGGHTEFYIRRWASDGQAESDKETSLFHFGPRDGGDGGGDADGDSDGDGDAGGGGDDGAGCACRTAGAGGEGAVLPAGLALLVLARRRRRGGSV